MKQIKLNISILIALLVFSIGCEKLTTDGVRLTRYPNGKIESEYTYKKGVKHGKFRRYDDSGNCIAEGLILGDQVTETRYEYYFEGGLKAMTPFKNNLKEGVEKNYYENGSVQSEFSYRDGKLNGSARRYSLNGGVEMEEEYKDNLLTGRFRQFFNGVLRFEKSYLKGKLNGPFKEYTEEGKVLYIKMYTDDVLDGVTKEFNAEGRLLHEYEYKAGVFIMEREYYDNETIMRETLMEAGKPALLKEYYPAGNLMREQQLEDGRPTQITEYYDNGLVMYRKFYNETGVLIKTDKYDPFGNYLSSEKSTN